MVKQKCLACKKKKELVDRSDYCAECYDVIKQKIVKLLDKQKEMK